jgi:predicted nucleotidyltransferase
MISFILNSCGDLMKPSLALAEHRDAIWQIVVRHRASNPRVFGSVVHGDDSETSDLDLLIDPSPDYSLLDMARIQVEIEALIGMPVDVVTLGFLPEKFRNQVLMEARPI